MMKSPMNKMIVTGTMALVGVMTALPVYSQPSMAEGVDAAVAAVNTAQSGVTSAMNGANSTEQVIENNLNDAANVVNQAQEDFGDTLNPFDAGANAAAAAALGEAGSAYQGALDLSNVAGDPTLRAAFRAMRDARAALEAIQEELIHYDGKDGRALRRSVRRALNRSEPRKPKTPKVASGPKRGLFGGGAMVSRANTNQIAIGIATRGHRPKPICHSY